MDRHGTERVWKVGELAAEAGPTVRTLPHYDRIGLVRPAGRTSTGHRLYTAGDVERLYPATRPYGSDRGCVTNSTPAATSRSYSDRKSSTRKKNPTRPAT
ncbi:MerR family DNA-binding transcriptional regulator [Nocardia grenadensis]